MRRKASISKSALGFGSALLLGAISFTTSVQADTKVCSNASLKGSFGFYRTGATSMGPLAALGILQFDGKGSVTGSQSISRNGAFQFDLPIGPAPYLVNENCTGKLFLADGVTEAGRIVVTDGGKGFYVFSESAGNAVYGVARKIGTGDDEDD